MYTCEDCGNVYQGEPEHRETHPGYEGPVTIAFCKDCTEKVNQNYV